MLYWIFFLLEIQIQTNSFQLMLFQICVSRKKSQNTMMGRLTGAVLVVSIPGDGSNEVDAGKSRHETLETVSLATL